MYTHTHTHYKCQNYDINYVLIILFLCSLLTFTPLSAILSLVLKSNNHFFIVFYAPKLIKAFDCIWEVAKITYLKSNKNKVNENH